jgi:hypothetical protein
MSINKSGTFYHLIDNRRFVETTLRILPWRDPHLESLRRGHDRLAEKGFRSTSKGAIHRQREILRSFRIRMIR